MTSSHWTEAKLFKFLRLYKRHECLWNPYSLEYKNCGAKSKAFSQILYEMNVFGLTVNECLNQIKHVRKNYKLEQRRLENLTFLGGRGCSNLLWYPLVNSMLSKVLADEDKLNRATAHSELVLVPKRLPLDAGDQGNRNGYGQRTVSWNHDEMTVCPYLAHSNFENDTNFYQNRNVPSNFIVTCERNEHISSCPTCGYSRSNSCGCYSMTNIEYHSDHICQDYDTQSQINYRPRTSYNYRNGMLEINSAVRIPVSNQHSPCCAYGSVIKSVTSEESEYNFNPISSNYQPEIQTVPKMEEFSTKRCENFSCKIPGIAVDKNSHPSNLGLEVIGATIENDNWHSKKTQEERGNVNQILCTRDLLEFISIAQDSICRNTEHQKSGPDNDKAPHAINVKNLTNERQLFPKVESENSVDIEREQHSNINMKTDVKVEKTSTVMSEQEQQTNDNIPIKNSLVKPQCRKENSTTNCKLESQGSGKRSKIDVLNENLLNVLYDVNGKISALKTTQDLVQESKNIVKHNLTKLVIDFIDETLNKPNRKPTVNTEERFILKKVAKDLKTLGDKNQRTGDDELAEKNSDQSQRNHGTKICNKTICWKEPIEESFNVTPCKSIRSSTKKMNCKENLAAERPFQSNKCIGNHFRMMAGADIDVDDDIMESNLFSPEDIQPKNKMTSIENCTFGNDKQTSCVNITSPNYEEYSSISRDGKLERDDENCGEIVGTDENYERFKTNPGEYDSAEVNGEIELGDSKSKAIRNKNLEVSSTNKASDHGYPVIVDKLIRAEGSNDLDLQDVKRRKESVLSMKKNFENQVDNLNNSLSIVQDTRIANSVTIHISVETCESKKSEITDKVVNKITRILRKTLDKNGLTIEKEAFFAKKNLITNENGDIRRKLIGNEMVWKTELKNIIGNLIKQKKSGEPIAFKVKTIILPVTNQSNNVTAEGVGNLTLSTKRRQNFDGTKKKAFRKSETGGNSQMKPTRSEVIRDMTESFLKYEEKLSNDEHMEMIHNNSDFNFESNGIALADDNRTITKEEEDYEMLLQKIHGKAKTRDMCSEEFIDSDSDTSLCKSNRRFMFEKQFSKKQTRKLRHRNIVPKDTLKNITHSDKILFRDVSPHKDYPHALSKLLKYLLRYENKNQSIPEKIGKPLRSLLQKNEFMKSDKKFEQNYRKNDSVVANFCDNLAHGNIDVYLCTEISQEDQPLMQKPIDPESCSHKNLRDNVNQISLLSNTAMQIDTQMKDPANTCRRKTGNDGEHDVEDWESFGDSKEETGIVKHCRLESEPYRQISKNSTSDESTTYTSTKGTEDTIWYPKYIEKMELSPTTHSRHINDTTNSQNNYKIIETIPSNYQYVSQTGLRSFKEDSEVPLLSSGSVETEKSNIHRLPKPSESKEDESLLEAKQKAVTDNQMRYCCTEDKTHSVCAPICDVTSRLRLCAIIKSPIEMSAINSDVSSNDTCRCDGLNKLSNADSKPRMKTATRLITKSCQTDPLTNDSNILDSQKHELKLDCIENLKSSFETGSSRACRQSSTAVNGTVITTNENVEQPDDLNNLKSTTIQRATIHSNDQNPVSASLDLPGFEGGSLMLEIKMLQPLFSIELKRGCKDLDKTVTSIKQCSCELLDRSNHDVVISLSEDSAIESSSKNGVILRQEHNINCNRETTSVKSVNCRGQSATNQDEEFMLLDTGREASSSRISKSQVCNTEDNSKKKNQVFSYDSKSSNPTAFNDVKQNERKEDCSDPGQCNVILETLRSLENREESSEIGISEFVMDNSEASKEKTMSEPQKLSFNQTQSSIIESLKNVEETSLRHITDPIIYKKLIDVINYIRDQSGNENCSCNENVENCESSQYVNLPCYTDCTAVDINAFASRVASQLRGLSTEAALRSQQRIQTLISNSRLEWEKRKRHR